MQSNLSVERRQTHRETTETPAPNPAALRLLRGQAARQRRLFWASFALLGVALFLALLTFAMPLLPGELALTRAAQTITTPAAEWVADAASFLGFSPWNAIFIGIVCVAVGWSLGWKHGAFLTVLTLAQGAANAGMRLTIARPRPSPELVKVFDKIGHTSFPSGHVMLYTVFFGFVAFLAWVWMRPSIWRTLVIWGSAILIVLNGPARLYLGAHWWADIVSAYLFGAIFLAYGIEFYLKYFLADRVAERD